MNKYRTSLLTLAALATSSLTLPAAAQDPITVATYGGEWGAALQACIIDPFTEATGIAVTPEPGVSAVTLSKLLQQQDAPVLDVVWMDGGVSEQAVEKGVIATINPETVPGVAGMLDEGIYKTDDGNIFAVSTGYYSLGLAYNTDEVETPPTSWKDLWKEEYSGTVTFPSPGNAMGVPFLAELAKMEGTSLDKIAPVLEDVKNLRVAAYFDTAGAGTNLFQSGEAIVGAHYASSAYAMRDQNLPIAFVVPEEGAIGGDIRLHLVANTPRMDSAEKFVDFAIGKDPAKCMAERIYVGPATKDVELSDDARQRMPWGADGSVKSLSLPDWNGININRAAIIEAFNRTVVAQ
ncbi:ABC transporter substrate-binding protein [Hoeflea sp. YIM 152468]|uniref:ABC transporter substrate-binding protein n=1 Tax=Hoeflea sp. YIM 152468 TaxID=3031759 RepID=UPI0023DAC067|nr:ABC transporter substrate-binding protein [Hoeflea sp. YIM 152468]MDF1608667.1 ABC transporter substrate-binding protein [Hoeflea sp. YIM 152468]